jgi:hypothetical protein
MYNCKYQILAEKGDRTPIENCKSCLADAINNKNCTKYEPISPLNLNGFFARSRLEDSLK